MSRCLYCGELFIGDRDGIGTHVSSVLTGLAAGLFTMAMLSILVDNFLR